MVSVERNDDRRYALIRSKFVYVRAFPATPQKSRITKESRLAINFLLICTSAFARARARV